MTLISKTNEAFLLIILVAVLAIFFIPVFISGLGVKFQKDKKETFSLRISFKDFRGDTYMSW